MELGTPIAGSQTPPAVRRTAERLDSVVVNAPTCIDSHNTLSAGGQYFQNFCEASTVGITGHGPSSGTFDVERNVVRAPSADGIVAESGNFTIEKNIIINATDPIDTTGAGTATVTKNICDDATDCSTPNGEPFTFNIDYIE